MIGARSTLAQLALGTALLVCPASSQAVAIVFDLTPRGAERVYWGSDPYTSHETAFSPGSSLTLETDANGDGVSGDYTIVSSHFVIEGRQQTTASDDPWGENGTTWSVIGELRGGNGRLAYEDSFHQTYYIDWTDPAAYSVDGTWQCYGSLCALFGLPDRVPMPYSELLAEVNATPMEAVYLFDWFVDGLIPSALYGVCDSIPQGCHIDRAGLPVARGVIGGVERVAIAVVVEGLAVPEPATALLLAVGFLSLTLRRRRRSGTMRRHEAA